MSFATALSGLNAASNNLAVTGNNIANANTVGFKESVSQFADVYASSLSGVSNTTPGSGVSVANDAQEFSQGTLQSTSNNLDMAISGSGFFTMAKIPPGGVPSTTPTSYTRDGEFSLNQNGYLVNNQGEALLAYKPNGTTVAAGFSVGVLQPVQIQTTTGQPTPTANVDLSVNLNANNAVPADTTFSPTDTNSYNSQTSVTIYDSLGTPHTLTSYFVKTTTTANYTQWDVYHYMSNPDTPTAQTPVDAGALGTTVTASGANPPVPATLTFSTSGNLVDPVKLTPVTAQYTLAPYAITPPTGAANISIADMNYTGTTQVNAAFSVNAQTQDGAPAGQLSGVSIDSQGVISAQYSNGNSLPLGQVALSNFPNTNGLSKLGNTSWGQNTSSGAPTLGQAGSNGFGSITSGSVETSNVSLSSELVNLIIAQQTYQANAKTISTQNTIMTSILQI